MIGRGNDRAVFLSYYAHRNPGQIIFFLCGEFIKYCFFIYIFSGDKAMLFQISHEHGQRPGRLVIIASEIHGGIGALLFHMSFQMIRDAAGGEDDFGEKICISFPVPVFKGGDWEHGAVRMAAV